MLVALALLLAPVQQAEEPVDPYTVTNANAGTTPFAGTAMRDAFGGQPGIHRLVNRLVDRNVADPRISETFNGQDIVRLRRTLFEQFCYILNAGCNYTGRDMAASHKDLGLQMADMNAMVENLQATMREDHIPFATQNRLLAKLAPMKRVVIVR